MSGDAQGSNPDKPSEAISPAPDLGEPLVAEGSEVEFIRTKTHFRDDLSVSKGQRGVIQALSGAVCSVKLQDDRIVTACVPTDLKPYVPNNSSWGTNHCKFMIRKGYLLDEEVEGVTSPRSLALASQGNAKTATTSGGRASMPGMRGNVAQGEAKSSVY